MSYQWSFLIEPSVDQFDDCQSSVALSATGAACESLTSVHDGLAEKQAFTLDGSQSTTWCQTLCCHRWNEVLNVLSCVSWYSTLYVMCRVSFVICLMKAHFLSYLSLGPVKRLSVRVRSRKERDPMTSYSALMLWSSNVGLQWTVTPCSHPATPVDLVS